jgi:hypothetical protein
MSISLLDDRLFIVTPGDASGDEIKIDPELESYIPEISDEEREQLESNIIERGGAIDPLTVWLRNDDDMVLLDGHNRFAICTRLGLPFAYRLVEFDTRGQATDWIDRNQLGRRNLDAKQMSLLRGRRYNRTKKANDGSRGNQHTQPTDKMSTAEALASEHGVNEKTIRRDGEYAQAVETLGIEREIVTGDVTASKAEIIKTAATLPDTPTARDVAVARETVKGTAAKPRRAKPVDKPTAGESRRKNGRLAKRITLSVLAIRDAVETLGTTDSAYREQVLAELRRCVDRLSRSQPVAPAKADKRSSSDDLRPLVAERWEAMRLWQKHWSLADMEEVRRLFIELIREEQKQFDQ